MYRYRYRAKQTQADAGADTDVDAETQPAQGKTGIEQTYTKVPYLQATPTVGRAWSVERETWEGRGTRGCGPCSLPSLPFVFYFIY